MLQAATEPFFSNNIDGWIKLLGFVIMQSVAVYTLIERKARREANLTEQLNGLGGRVGLLETSTTKAETKIDLLEKGCGEDRVLHNGRYEDLTRRVGAVEHSQDSIRTLLSEGIESIKGQVASIERALSVEQKEIMKKLVRLETINELRGRIPPQAEDIHK